MVTGMCKELFSVQFKQRLRREGQGRGFVENYVRALVTVKLSHI